MTEETATMRSMKSHQPQASTNVDWVTPRWILEPLGSFDLDPCTPHQMPWDTAAMRYTRSHDGLLSRWFGRVWLNPPFDKKSRGLFLEKMAMHGNGIVLVPASTEAKWFDWIWGYADSVLFLHKRPYFHYPDGRRAAANSGCSICLASYGCRNVEALQKSGLGVNLRIPKAAECRFLIAARCPVAVECTHGFDVCLECDPCNCKSEETKGDD